MPLPNARTLKEFKRRQARQEHRYVGRNNKPYLDPHILSVRSQKDGALLYHKTFPSKVLLQVEKSRIAKLYQNDKITVEDRGYLYKDDYTPTIKYENKYYKPLQTQYGRAETQS